ncbi:hypothetical protein N9A25_00145 [bacterium]|nr:hypothetical protein [bacterium]
MYKIVPWTENLDLRDFYESAKQRGFENNSSQHMLVDCFHNEREWNTWILYYNNEAVGSVAAHSFDEMGENCYRIAARTCVLTDKLPEGKTLRTRNQIVTHQHATSQFLIPVCIEWAGRDNKLFITSNNLEGGSQRIVHNVYFPAMTKTGQAEHICDMQYRGTMQSVWKLNVERFYEELNKYPRWGQQ